MKIKDGKIEMDSIYGGSGKYWILARRMKGEYPKNVRRGKWLIFVSFENADIVWEKVADNGNIIGRRYE